MVEKIYVINELRILREYEEKEKIYNKCHGVFSEGEVLKKTINSVVLEAQEYMDKEATYDEKNNRYTIEDGKDRIEINIDSFCANI